MTALGRISGFALVCDLTLARCGCSLLKPIKHGAAIMAIEARIRELGVRHQTLERAIEDELRRPAADTIRLKDLKRRKLRLKEQIETMRQERGPVEIRAH
jgi:hypothetical protein